MVRPLRSHIDKHKLRNDLYIIAVAISSLITLNWQRGWDVKQHTTKYIHNIPLS